MASPSAAATVGSMPPPGVTSSTTSFGFVVSTAVAGLIAPSAGTTVAGPAGSGFGGAAGSGSGVGFAGSTFAGSGAGEGSGAGSARAGGGAAAGGGGFFFFAAAPAATRSATSETFSKVQTSLAHTGGAASKLSNRYMRVTMSKRFGSGDSCTFMPKLLSGTAFWFFLPSTGLRYSSTASYVDFLPVPTLTTRIRSGSSFASPSPKTDWNSDSAKLGRPLSPCSTALAFLNSTPFKMPRSSTMTAWRLSGSLPPAFGPTPTSNR